MRILIAFCITSLYCCVPETGLASDILIASPNFEGLLNESYTGPYQNILREAANRADLSYKEKYIPEKRAIVLFRSKKYDCIYSFGDKMKQEFGSEHIITSFPINAMKEYIFTNKGNPALTSVTQLKDIHVGAKLGTEIWHQELANSGIDIEYAPTDIQNIKKLEINRIQAFLGFLPDVTAYLDKMNYSPDYPLIEGYDEITCHANPETRAFLTQLSKQLREMKKDQTTARILGNFYVEFSDQNFPE